MIAGLSSDFPNDGRRMITDDIAAVDGDAVMLEQAGPWRQT